MSGDVVEVFDFHFRVPILLRIKDHIGTVLARAKAHIRFHFDVTQAFIGDLLLEFRHELFRAPGLAIDVLTNETHSTH
jgi:hypothetical protein